MLGVESEPRGNGPNLSVGMLPLRQVACREAGGRHRRRSAAAAGPEAQRACRQLGAETEEVGIGEMGAAAETRVRPDPGPPPQALDELARPFADEDTIHRHVRRNVGGDARKGQQRLSKKTDFFGKTDCRRCGQGVEQGRHPLEAGETAAAHLADRLSDGELNLGVVDRLAERGDRICAAKAAK